MWPLVRAAVELGVFAPLGVVAALAEGGPGAARREVARAGANGRSTVARSLAEVRASMGAPAGDRRAEPATASPEPSGADDRSGGDGAVESPERPEAALAHVPDVEALALPDYDHLPASDVVAKLPTLTPADRALIGAYEAANRRRRTVLGRLEQLGDA